LQRGGAPSAHDRRMGRYFGIAAVDLVIKRDFGKMVSYQNGRVTSVSLKDVIGKLKLVNVPGGLLYTFPMLCDAAPYNNNDLRMALKYSVNRQQMLDTILRGYGTLGNDHPIAPIVKYSASDLPQREYDPDKAKFYFKKAGIEGHQFKLHTSDSVFAGAVDAAQLWQQDAQKAGLNFQVVKEPKDGYWDNVWNKKPFSAAYWFARATADWIFTQTYSGTTVNSTYNNVPVGTYILSGITGGPTGWHTVSITPSATQVVTAGNTTTFTLNFQ